MILSFTVGLIKVAIFILYRYVLQVGSSKRTLKYVHLHIFYQPTPVHSARTHTHTRAHKTNVCLSYSNGDTRVLTFQMRPELPGRKLEYVRMALVMFDFFNDWFEFVLLYEHFYEATLPSEIKKVVCNGKW